MPLSSEVVRENYARIREEVGPGVTVVAATKYVSVDDLGVLAEAGGGLYWVAAGIVFAVTGAIVNAWVLLVEILR